MVLETQKSWQYRGDPNEETALCFQNMETDILTFPEHIHSVLAFVHLLQNVGLLLMRNVCQLQDPDTSHQVNPYRNAVVGKCLQTLRNVPN